MAVMAQAKILRVSNVEGSSAPYTTFADAFAVAEDGDTLIFDGSATSYGEVVIDTTKSIVLLGHGYLLADNNVSALNDCDAIFENIEIQSEGTIVQGVNVNNTISIRANNVVVTKCKAASIRNGGGWTGYYSGIYSGIVIHKNYVKYTISGISGSTSQYFTNSQITNNILTNWAQTFGGITGMKDDCLIQYNTVIERLYGSAGAYVGVIECSNCTVKNNLIYSANSVYGSNNEVSDNTHLTKDYTFTNLANDASILEDLKDYTAQGVGAGAGTDPYVISGVPAGPMIEDIDMPTTVEKGKSMEVTVKVKIK